MFCFAEAGARDLRLYQQVDRDRRAGSSQLSDASLRLASQAVVVSGS